jgi:hypothetical protein
LGLLAEYPGSKLALSCCARSAGGTAKENIMANVSRREALVSTGLAAAFGLAGSLRFITAAQAQAAPVTNPGFHQYRVGTVEVTALYDGFWQKPHDPAFIKNASIEDTKQALAKAGQPSDFVPIPLTVLVLKIGGQLIMVDAGSGGQWQPTAGRLAENMKAALIRRKSTGC